MSIRYYEDDYDYERVRRRKTYACHDGMCGADDCTTCNGARAYLADEEPERESETEPIVRLTDGEGY